MSHLAKLVIGIDESDRGATRVSPDGRVSASPKLTVTHEGAEMLRQGYLCGNCLEDLRPLGAFPEQCPCCGFRVRALQAALYAQQFVGEEKVGSKISLSDEIDRLGDMGIWTPGPGGI